MLLGEEMSPLFMDTGYVPNSPSSLSAEESHSNTAGSEREGEGQQMEKRGTKRQEKNRDAARKSRKKQTERADELHEELQGLERSNSALHKEIASLKKELHLYMTALDRHKPLCRLQDSTPNSSSTICPSVSPSAKCQSSSSPPRVPTQAPRTTQPAAPSCSTSLTSSMGLSAPTTTTLTSSISSSSELLSFSSSVTVPYSASFTTIPAPHSLFSDDPPTLIASRPTNVTPVCTSLVSNPVPSSSLTTAAKAQSSQGANQERSSVSEKAFSTLQPGALDALIMKQGSFKTASSNVVPPYSHSAAVTAGLVAHGCSMNIPQLHPGHIGENPIISSPLHSLSRSTLQDPALQSLSAFPQANPELSPASAFASKSSYSQHIAPSPVPLLSLLTVPSPVNVSQTTSSSFDGPPPQPPPSLPPLGDPSRDLSLSELLEVNDWILWD